MIILTHIPRHTSKNIWKILMSYSGFLSKGEIPLREYISEGISHPVFYGDLVYNLRRVNGTPNFVSSGSKVVERL